MSQQRKKAPFEARVGGEMSWGAAEMRSEVGAGVSVVAVAIKKHTFKTYFGGKSTSFADGFHMESGRESGGGIKEKFQVLATAWG